MREWENRAVACHEEPAKRRKTAVPARTSSWQFLKALDNVLRVTTGTDLKAYQLAGYNFKHLE
eukprot:4783441-Amphidinium_carterae.1